MDKQLTTTTTKENSILKKIKKDPLYQVVDQYLKSVKTKKGHKPTKEDKNNFLLTCVNYKLNPIKKQIYLMPFDSEKEGPSFSYILSASGFATIASRTQLFAGNDQPRFTYLNNTSQYPESCSVTVYKLVNGVRCPFTGTAYFSERAYDKYGLKSMFRKQPRTMLEKCARVAALRIAFPDDLGNMYDKDEMPRDETDTTQVVTIKPKEQKSESYLKLDTIIKSLGKEKRAELIQNISDKYSIESIDELTEDQILEILNKFAQKNTSKKQLEAR